MTWRPPFCFLLPDVHARDGACNNQALYLRSPFEDCVGIGVARNSPDHRYFLIWMDPGISENGPLKPIMDLFRTLIVGLLHALLRVVRDMPTAQCKRLNHSSTATCECSWSVTTSTSSVPPRRARASQVRRDLEVQEPATTPGVSWHRNRGRATLTKTQWFTQGSDFAPHPLVIFAWSSTAISASADSARRVGHRRLPCDDGRTSVDRRIMGLRHEPRSTKSSDPERNSSLLQTGEKTLKVRRGHARTVCRDDCVVTLRAG